MSKLSWRVEIEEWPVLERGTRRLLLRAAGDLGAEWWSQGWLVFGAPEQAFAWLDACRARGYRCRLRLVAYEPERLCGERGAPRRPAHGS